MSTNATVPSPARSRTPAPNPRMTSPPRSSFASTISGVLAPEIVTQTPVGVGVGDDLGHEMVGDGGDARLPPTASAITRWLARREAVRHGVRQPRREVCREVVVEHRVALPHASSTGTVISASRSATAAIARSDGWPGWSGMSSDEVGDRHSRLRRSVRRPERRPISRSTADRPTGGSCPPRTSASRDRPTRHAGGGRNRMTAGADRPSGTAIPVLHRIIPASRSTWSTARRSRSHHPGRGRPGTAARHR